MSLLAVAFAAAADAPAPNRDYVPHSVVIDHFGECMLKQDEKRARAIMETAPGSPEELRIMKSLAKRGGFCIKGMWRLEMRESVVRGSVAGALLRRDEEGLARLRQTTPVAATRVASLENDRAQMTALAECAVAAAPAEAVAVITSEQRSDGERVAIAALQPALADCAPDAATIRMDRHGLRSNLADALYRKLHPEVPPASFAGKKD